MGSLVLGFGAGALSVLSPCVLPLLPIVVASALHRHRHGPLALAAGLVISSAAVGLAFASVGVAGGVDRDVVRATAAAAMAVVGVVLLVPKIQDVLAAALSPIARAASDAARRVPGGIGGQLVLGALLGVVWTPCTGPTLAAAITVATRSESLGHAAAVMLVFGIGAATPLLALAYGSRRALAAPGARLARVAGAGKAVIGAGLLLVGALALTGADKRVEAWMVDRMPQWLLELTTFL